MKRNIDGISSQNTESQSKQPKEFVDFLSIPVDCIRCIFSFLNPTEFHYFSVTCKSMLYSLGKMIENSYNSDTIDLFYHHRLYDLLHRSDRDFRLHMDNEYTRMSRLKDLMKQKMNQIDSLPYFEKMKQGLSSRDLEFLDVI